MVTPRKEQRKTKVTWAEIKRRQGIGAKKGNQNATKHGIHRADNQLMHDRRTKVAQTIIHYQQTLIESLGGIDSVSPQQRIILDRVSFLATKCLLAEAEMIKNSNTPEINKRYYISFSNSLAKCLQLLGMGRVARQLPTLKDYIKENYSISKSANGETIEVEVKNDEHH